MAYQLSKATPLAVIPDTLVFPGNKENLPSEKVGFTFGEVQNALSGEGSLVTFRPTNRVKWNPITSITGNRIGFDNTDEFDSLKTGSYNGMSVNVWRASGSNITEVKDTTVTQWHAAVKTNDSSIMPDNTVITGPSALTTFVSWYKPSSPIWYAVAHVNAAGDQSNWVITTASILSPAAPVTNATPGNTTTARMLTGVVDGGIALPTGVSAVVEGKDHRISWTTPPAGLGIIVRRLTTDPAVTTLNNTIDLADASGLQVGDLVIVKGVFGPNTLPSDVFTPRLSTLRRTEFDLFHRVGGTPFSGVADCQYIEADGEGVMRLNMQPGAVREIERYCIGGFQQTYYGTLIEGRTYEARIKIQRHSGNGTLNISASTVNVNTTPTLDGTLQTISVPFTRTAASDTAGASSFQFEFNGGTTGLDVTVHSIWIGEVGVGLDGPEVGVFMKSKLDGLNAGHARDHQFVKTNPKSLDAKTMTDTNGFGGGSLPIALRALAGRVDQYWLQVPPWWSRSEWHKLIEYLCAPYNAGAGDTPANKPFAYKRVQQGRVAPWIDAFPGGFKVEPGNELWNPMSAFWFVPNFSGMGNTQGSAAIMNGAIAAFQSSPYWSLISGRIEFAAGGRSGTWSYSQSIGQNSPGSDFVTLNLYNGRLWEEIPAGSGTGFSYSDAYAYNLAQGVVARWENEFDKQFAWLDAVNVGRAKPLRIGGYEQNQTTDKLPGPSIPQAEMDAQDVAWTTMGVQTPIVDQFMSFMARGAAFCDFFALSGNGGGYWDGFQREAKGGATYASLQWFGLLNTQGLLPGTVTSANDAINVGFPSKDTAGNIYPVAAHVGCYTIKSGTKTAVLVLSRRIPGQGPDAPSGDGISDISIVAPRGETSCTKWVMSGAYNQSNNSLANKDLFQLSSSVVAVTDGKVASSLPPAQVQLFIFG